MYVTPFPAHARPQAVVVPSVSDVITTGMVPFPLTRPDTTPSRAPFSNLQPLSKFPMRAAQLCAILPRQTQRHSVRDSNFGANHVTFVTCKQLTLYLSKI